MNSTVFTVGLACLVVGAILGMVVKHIQDTKYFKELADFSTQQMRKVMREDEEIIEELYGKIERLTAENNRLQIENAKNFKPVSCSAKIVNPEEVRKFFTNLTVEALPDDWEDIDFGGNF